MPLSLAARYWRHVREMMTCTETSRENPIRGKSPTLGATLSPIRLSTSPTVAGVSECHAEPLLQGLYRIVEPRVNRAGHGCHGVVV